MYDKKWLPYDSIFVAPKSFTCKTFFLIRSIAYENLRLTANNHDKSWQHTNNAALPHTNFKVRQGAN